MKNITRILSLILCLTLGIMTFSFVIPAFATGDAIFVSPDGDDNAKGTILAPLATPEAAKAKANAVGGNVTVYLREGSYHFDDTLRITASDKANVTYAAYNNERVVFTSGTAYTGFTETTVNGVRAFKKNIGKDASFNVLFNDKTTLNRTRYPETGYLTVDKISEDDVTVQSEEHYFVGYTGAYAKAGDLREFKNTTDIVVRILHYWKDEMLTLTSYDAATNHMTFNHATSMEIREDDRYFLENVFETLDEPGEWYLDKSEGVLYYIPEEGENADTATVWGSKLDTMVSVDGVDGISFEGIIFRGNGYEITSQRDGSQASIEAKQCLSYTNCKDFTVKNCEFRDIGGGCVYLGYNVQNALIDSCLFNNIGAQAVFVQGDNLPIEDTHVTRDITITNNSISYYGRTYFNAVAVLIIHANSVNVNHNEIHDGTYTAISVGWVWGYSYTVTYNNKICDNLIYNIGQGWLSDMGGIYTLGNQPGTVLSGNVIHNVAADPNEGGYGGWGIYLDEGSAYILVEKNLVYACGSDGYHLHYGSYNTVRNNIFALNGESQVRVVSNTGRVTPADGGTVTADFTHNILLSDGGACAYSHMQGKEYFNESNNIFWDLTNGSEIYVCSDSDSEKSWSIERAIHKGYISNAVIADPGFADASDFDFTLSEDSEAVKSGFEAWDYSNAGTVNGTTVGTSLSGGATAYNACAEKQNYTQAKEIFHWIVNLFYKVVSFFEKLFGVN